MYIELGNIFDVENIDDMIDNSFNGTCFSYSWFLKLKDSFKILKIYNSAKELQGFMPIFKSTPKTIAQSTMYIPYGGLVLFSLPREGRNQIRYIRQVEKVLCNYLQENYDDIQFSLDNKITDIMPFIRSGFTPEVRYTYKLDLTKGLNVIYQNFGGDRKKDIKKAVKRNIKFVVDSDYSYFDSKEAMKWEKKYGFDDFNERVFAFGSRYIGEKLWQVGDVKIIDGGMVNGTANLIGRLSGVVRKLQTGLIYHYAFAMIIGVFLLLTFFTKV